MTTIAETSASQNCSTLISGSTPNVDSLLSLYKEWKSNIDFDQPIITKDYLFKDPLIKKMDPVESFVFTLGLELALESACDSFRRKLKVGDESKNIEAMPLFIENKQEFLTNLASNKKLIAKRSKPFRFNYLSCQLCDFKTESQIVLDQHLTNPHTFVTVFVCNFCPIFRSHSKEEYRNHLYASHNRICNFDRVSSCMCSVCDFECGNDKEKLQRHEQFLCSFRAKDGMDCDALSSIQQPKKIDSLYHEYLFNKKPLEPNNVHLSFSATSNYYDLVEIKTMESLINPQLLNEPIFPTILKMDATTVKMNMNSMASSNANLQEKIAEIRKKELCCHICNATFKGASKLTEIIKHIQSLHDIKNPIDLNSALIKFILPQISPKNKKTSNDDQKFTNTDSNKNLNGKTTIKIIKQINSSTTLLQKNNKAIKCLKLDGVDNPPINNPIRQPSPPKLTQSAINTINIKHESYKEKNKITKRISEYERAGVNKKFISSFSGPGINHRSNQQPAVPNFETEKKMIINVLKQNKLILSYPIKFNINLDNLFNHLHETSLNVKCFICNLHAGNLIEHLWQIHSFEPKMAIANCQCVCCGIKCITLNNLIIHQFNVHQSIALISTNKLYAVLNKANTNNIFGEVETPTEKPTCLSPISKINSALTKSPMSSPPLLTAAKLSTIQLSPVKPQMPVLSASVVSVEPKEKKIKKITKSKLPLLIDLTINDVDDKFMSEKTKNIMKIIKSKKIKFKSAKSIADSAAKEVKMKAKPMQQCQLCEFKYEVNSEFREHFELVHMKNLTVKLERLRPVISDDNKKLSNKLTEKKVKKTLKEEASDRRRSDRLQKMI